MVALYVNGTKVGTISDSPNWLQKYAQENQEVVLKDDVTGRTLGTFTPEPLCPWEPNLTREEIERRKKEGGMTLNEFWKRIGA